MDHAGHDSSSSTSAGGGGGDNPFVPDGGWNVYDSYVTDPYYRSLLLAGFCGLFGLAFLFALPSLISYVFVNRRWRPSFLYERWSSSPSYSRLQAADNAIVESEKTPRRSGRWSAGRPLPEHKKAATALWSIVQGHLWRTLSLPRMRVGRRRRSYLSLSNGSIFAILASGGVILACILPEQQLRNNANRLGFLALGILPIIFLLSMKAFSPLQLLLGKSYEKLNFLHRWLGRMVLVLILAHAGLWIDQWRRQSNAYAREMLSQDMQKWGLLALAFLFLIAATSIRPLRELSYPTFFFLHIVGFVGLIVGVNLHTPYAQNWAGYAVCAIYGVDLLGRICHWRMREVTLEPLVDAAGESSGMTKITVHDLSGGWRAGQHVQVRLFYAATSEDKQSRFGGLSSTFRSFESHPYTIAQAPPDISILPAHQNGTLSLYAKAVTSGRGSYATWSHELHDFARASVEQANARRKGDGVDRITGVKSVCTLEGPYGGPGYAQLDRNETVFLVACGSGMSYIVAVLDELVGRTVRGLRGARTRVVEVVWVVRHASCVGWFSQTLDDLARAAEESGLLSVNVKVYATCTSYDTEGKAPACACNDYRVADIRTAPSGGGCSCRQETKPASSNAQQDVEVGAACCCSAPSSSSTPLIKFSSPSISLHYSRADIPSLLSETIKSAVNPCISCVDCRCAEYSGDGTCGGGGSAGGCGGCAMPPSMDSDGGARRREMDGEEIEVLPKFSVGEYDEEMEEKEQAEKGCCLSKKATPRVAVPSKGGCCGPKAPSERAKAKASCCSPGQTASSESNCCGGSGPSQRNGCGCSSTTPASYPPASSNMPAEVRTGGLGIAACGPSSMLAELGNAIADIPLQKKVKIGGIEYVSEGFEL